MKKYIIFSLLFVNLGFGQNINTLPSIANPEVSSIGKFLDNPINLSNGQTAINIDLVTLYDKDFNVPISLNYNTSGIRVSEIASRVGLGWSINTGGFIVRSTRGLPDDDANGYLNSTKIADFLNLTLTQQSGVLQSEIDFESDVYSFNFFGISGTFYFDQNGNIYTHQKTDILIEPKFLNNKIIGWLITNTNGTKFYLGLSKDNLRTANDLTSSAGTSNIGAGWTLIDLPAQYINTWHLVDIETQNNKLISYEYESSNINYWNLASEEYYIPSVNNSDPNMINKVQKSYVKNEDTTHRVKKIFSNAGIIEFLYEQPRVDLIGDFALNKVILKKDNKIIDSYTLNYDYHISNNIYSNSISFESQNQRTKRLMLQNIKQNINNSDNKTYKFEYHIDNGFPERLSFSQDHWGFFNGKINDFYFPKVFIPGGNYNLIETKGGDKKVDFQFSKSLSLKKITYPTGGYTMIDFESNKSFNIELKPWIVNYDEELISQYDSQGINGTEEKILNISNLVPDSQYLSWEVNFNTPCENPSGFDCPYAQLFFFIDGFYQLISDTRGIDVKRNFTIPNPGNLKIKIKFTNYSQSFNENSRNDIVVKITKAKAQNINQISVGGIRTKEIKYFNHTNEQISIKKFNYNFFDTPNKSSGHALYTPLFIIENFPLGPDSHVYLLKSNSIFPLYNNGNSVLYTESEAINESEEIGKTEYYYSFTHDGIGMMGYQLWKNVLTSGGNIPVVGELPGFKNLVEIETPKENYSNRRGVLLKTKRYSFDNFSNTFKTVFEDINIYDFSFSTTNTHRIKNIFVKSIQEHSGYAEYNNFLESTKLLSNIKNTYFNSGIVQEKTDYFYDSNNYNSRINLKEEKKHTSSGDTIETKYFYPQDPEMATKPFVDSLISKNMTGIPLKTETFKNGEKLSTQETVYKNWGNNLLAPEIIRTAKGNQSLEDKLKYNVMDNTNGNPLEIQQESGIKIIYIWGYNKTQPIAKIENATYSQVQQYVANLQTLSNGTNEASLITALNSLRTALPNAMITTYTYKPLVGISTVTDPKGDKQTYHYDGFNRLQFVKDAQGNILSENQYHFRTQN
jgi:hypothetical protein